MTRQEQLQSRQLELNDRNQVIQAKATAAGRDLNPAELAEMDGNFAEFDSNQAELATLAGPGPGRRTQAQHPMAQNRLGGGPGRAAGPGAPAGYSGFKAPGEFFQAVKNSCARGGTLDPRLIMDAPTTTSSEGIGADGGFLVPPAFRQGVTSAILGEKSLIPYCDQVYVPGNSFVTVVDGTAPWDNTAGPRAYWIGEGKEIPQSKVALKDTIQRLNKLTCLVPVTEELMEDAPSLDAYLRRTVEAKFVSEQNFCIVQGSGAGEPWGLLNSPALVSVAKETGQDAKTLVLDNILKAWVALAPGSESSAIWLAHKNVLPELMRMSLGAVLSPAPVYLPAGGVSGKPFDTLLGRPVIFSEACPPLGNQGDLILCDLSKYQVTMKASGIRTDISVHAFFEYDTSCFRFVFRCSGSPLWSAPIAARDGGGYYSPFIAIDERA
jgi:HK97 family phage major capsid protein